jgi:hypothetical protein
MPLTSPRTLRRTSEVAREESATAGAGDRSARDASVSAGGKLPECSERDRPFRRAAPPPRCRYVQGSLLPNPGPRVGDPRDQLQVGLAGILDVITARLTGEGGAPVVEPRTHVISSRVAHRSGRFRAREVDRRGYNPTWRPRTPTADWRWPRPSRRHEALQSRQSSALPTRGHQCTRIFLTRRRADFLRAPWGGPRSPRSRAVFSRSFSCSTWLTTWTGSMSASPPAAEAQRR